MPQLAILLERRADERFQARRYQRVDLAHRCGRAIEDGVEDNRVGGPTKGLGPRRHLIEHHAQ